MQIALQFDGFFWQKKISKFHEKRKNSSNFVDILAFEVQILTQKNLKINEKRKNSIFLAYENKRKENKGL